MSKGALTTRREAFNIADLYSHVPKIAGLVMSYKKVLWAIGIHLKGLQGVNSVIDSKSLKDAVTCFGNILNHYDKPSPKYCSHCGAGLEEKT